eukprot:jgi/Botrbrau1/7848/Bobra.9_2s0025.1
MADLNQYFTAVNASGSGQITPSELQHALALGGLTFSLQVCAQMIRMHDKDGSGTISRAEFGDLHGFLDSMRTSFEKFDLDRSGSLSPSEIESALKQAGFQLDRPAFEALFRAYDPDRSGSLSLLEYLALTLFIRSVTATFQAFDQQRTGSISLNFNQFVYAVASCK